MMENITIASPLVLFLFVPILLFLITPFVRRRGGITIPDKRSILSGHRAKIFILQAVRTGLLLVALLGIILILAGLSNERTYVSREYVMEESRSIAVALDASGSMTLPLQEDYKALVERDAELRPENNPSVFTLAKEITTQIVCERPHDRFGLIIFGSDVYSARTFTNSCGEFKKVLRGDLKGDLKDDNFVLRQYSTGTEIGNALNEADHMFSGSEVGRARAVLLISDLGDLNTESIIDKISTLLLHDVRVYIFAVNPKASVFTTLEKVFVQEERVRIYRILSRADFVEARRSLDILQPEPHVVARTIVMDRKSPDILFIIVGATLAIWVCIQPLIRKIH